MYLFFFRFPNQWTILFFVSLSLPSDCLLEPIFKSRLWGPAESSNLVVINPVPLVVDCSVSNILNDRVLVLQIRTHQTEQMIRDIAVANFKLGSNIVRFPNNALVQNRVKGLCNILAKHKTAHVRAVAMQAALFPSGNETDELGNQLFRKLVRTKRVIATRDDDGHLVRVKVRASKHLSCSLGRSVGVLRGQHIALVKGTAGFRVLTVNLICGNVPANEQNNKR